MVFCGAGKYCCGDWLSCKTCPAGYACAHWTKGGKSKCRTGEYSDPGWEKCDPCPAGSYCLHGIRYDCESGFYQPETRATNCYRCDEGLWSASLATGSPFVKKQKF